MSRRSGCVLAASAALLLFSGLPAAADPPTVRHSDPPPSVNPELTPACGFVVMVDLEITWRTFVTHDPSPLRSRQERRTAERQATHKARSGRTSPKPMGPQGHGRAPSRWGSLPH